MEFAGEDLDIRKQVLGCLRAWRGPSFRDIWFEEVVSLAPEARDALPVPEEYELACRFFERFSQEGRGMLGEGISVARIAWDHRCAYRLVQPRQPPSARYHLERSADRSCAAAAGRPSAPGRS